MSSDNRVTIPWNAWFGDKNLSLTFPENWNIDYFELSNSTPVDKLLLYKEADLLLQKISELRPGRITIAVDDLTRPLSYSSFFDYFFEKFETIKYNVKIFIIIGLGTHGPLSDEELYKKLGLRAMNHNSVIVKNHDFINDVVYAGFDWGKIPVKINKYFLDAEFRIIFSTIVPHPFAGFSGGAKMVLPGLSNIEITERTHKMALMGFVGGTGKVTDNKFRKILDGFMQEIKVDYFIGFLSNGYRECIGVKGGPLHETYYKIAEEAVKSYTVDLPDIIYDIVWLNAYPKDNELLQIDTAFVPILSANRKFWNDQTAFIISAACSKGMGKHDLLGPGGLLYRKPQKKRNLKQNKLLFFTPTICQDEFQKIYWSEYQLFNDLNKLMSDLTTSFKNDINVAIFPQASIELVA